MKGKIVYTAIVEKEIEIPDEIIKIVNKNFLDRSSKEDVTLEDFTESIWDSVDYLDRCGMYYEKDGHEWVIEEYERRELKFTPFYFYAFSRRGLVRDKPKIPVYHKIAILSSKNLVTN